ncbi:MAG: TolC family protein, partial [Verrucomicrobiales bacterium]|nr:TolC family protein [Verrucomicrobiales bacterium]
SRASRLLAVSIPLATLACGLAMAEPAADPSTPIPITPQFLTRLVEEARTNHPGLRAAAARVVASERAAAAVRTWDDPMFRWGGSVTSESGQDLEMMGDLYYEAEQKLPLFGKAQAMRREAEAATSVADAEKDFRFQILRRSIAQAAGQLALADEAVAIGSDDLAQLDRMTTFARERQRAGLDATLDLLRIENERDKRNQQLVTDRQQRELAAAGLNRLLARPKDSPWPALELPPPAPEFPLSEQLLDMGTRYEPRLQVMRREIAMAEAGVDVARRARLPDVTLGIEGRQWSGSGDFREGMFTVGLNLPRFNRGKYRADIDRSRARLDALRADTEDYTFDVRQELVRVWTKIDAARREALLYGESILPRSELAVSNALAAWTAGRGMFLDVLEARRMRIEARLMRARAVNEQHQMIIELITCCGIGELDSLDMLVQPTPRS